jgi:hypothetical protein
MVDINDSFSDDPSRYRFKAGSSDCSIDTDSPGKRRIAQSTDFSSEIKSRVDLTVWVTRVFKSERLLCQKINPLRSIGTIECE